MLLGDSIASLIQKIIGEKAVKWLHDKECGCNKRQEYLNNKHRQLIDWWRWKVN